MIVVNIEEDQFLLISVGGNKQEQCPKLLSESYEISRGDFMFTASKIFRRKAALTGPSRNCCRL